MGIFKKKQITLQQEELKILEKKELEIYSCITGALNDLLSIFGETKRKKIDPSYIQTHLSSAVDILQKAVKDVRESILIIKKEEKISGAREEELKRMIKLLRAFQSNYPDNKETKECLKEIDKLEQKLF